IAIVLELCGISALPFAVGVYLPIAASTPIFVGGMVRWVTERMAKARATKSTEGAENKSGSAAHDSDSSPGVLLSSGLIAGGSIAGICLAISTLAEGWAQKMDFSRINPLSESDAFATLIFLALAVYLYKIGSRKTA
ncbi:MAG: OPT/YSL family transporter, partial [Bdellovibrionales bacterium]|nr:OPT/YSL family transporter [Bdellovibrionales bacterium]